MTNQRDSKIRVLQVSPDMNSGGAENFIMNIYRRMDREKVQFDFLLHHSYDSFFEDEIRAMGGHIYKYPVLENGRVVSYQKYVLNLLLEHPEITIVHSHMCSLACLLFPVAKKAGCKVRICHSHSSNHDKGAKGSLKFILSRFAPNDANVLLACSHAAGKYLFGKRPYQVIHNGIDTSRFSFNEKARREVRDEYGIGNDLLVGHIGRFTYAKNHPFILKIFSEVHKQRPSSKLMLVGKGEDKENIQQRVQQMGLTDSVVFVDVTKTPERYYSAFDVFLFPSFFEGLPLAGIEAQCEGLQCFFSDGVSSEVGVSTFARFLSLDDSPSEWARAICRCELNEDRRAGREEVIAAGYDSADCAKQLYAGYVTGFGLA